MTQPPCVKPGRHPGASTLIRFCAGLEAVQDLQDDIEQALNALRWN